MRNAILFALLGMTAAFTVTGERARLVSHTLGPHLQSKALVAPSIRY